MNCSSSNGNLRIYSRKSLLLSFRMSFFQKVAFIITIQKQEKVTLLLYLDEITDCLCVLESPYFCLVFRCILHSEDEWQYQFCKGHLVAKKLGAKDLSVTFFHKMGQKVPYGEKVCICLQAEKKEAQMRCRKSRPLLVRAM